MFEEERREIAECDVKEFGSPSIDSSGKTIAILGDRWWPHAAKQEGDINMTSKTFLCNIWKQRKERPNVAGVSIRSRNDAPSQKVCVVYA